MHILVPEFVMLACLALALAIPIAQNSSQHIDIRVDSARSEVVLSLRGVHLPASASYDVRDIRGYFSWPVNGWIRGFRIDLLDSAGHLLPRTMLHHGGVANFSRRQLAYPMVERLFAAGRETPTILLPEGYGVPLGRGADLGMYVALVNASDTALENVTVRMTAAWTPESRRPHHELFPIVLGSNPDFLNDRSFDIPPGRSVTSAEFTVPVGGWLRGVGAHAHDYAVELRLEDARTGKTLVRLEAKRDAKGRLISIASTKFPLWRHGLALVAGHTYRVVSVYENPTSDVISRGAMAFLAGAFVPRDLAAWPELDLTSAEVLADVALLRGTSVVPKASHAHHR